jgi:HEAT repeat protein
MNAQSELDRWIAEIKSPNQVTFEEAYHDTRPTGSLVIPRLVAEMHGASDTYTRGKFIELLGEMGDDTVVPHLLTELSHPDQTIRDWAVTALRAIGGESAERAIREYGAANPE